MQNIFKGLSRLTKVRQPSPLWQKDLSKYMSTIAATKVTTPNAQPAKPQLDPSFKVRQMTLTDLKTVFEWASDVSWYLSPQDAEVCYRSDPRGLFIGEVKGEPMCSYVGFNYGDYYFLTLHIVKEQYQNIGYGKKIEELTRFFYKDAKIIFFDAADEGIAKYTNLGYHTFCWIKTFQKKAQGTLGPNIVDLKEIPLQEVLDYDLSVFGYPREKLLRSILQEPSYKTLAVKKEGKLKGFGLLRKCHKDVGYALSAIYADEKEIARELLESLQSFVVGEDVYLEVFDCNPKAMELASEQGWNMLFECKRMYGGEAPKLDRTRLYGDYCF